MGTELVLGKEARKMWGRTILTKMKLIYHGMHTLFPCHDIYIYILFCFNFENLKAKLAKERIARMLGMSV